MPGAVRLNKPVLLSMELAMPEVMEISQYDKYITKKAKKDYARNRGVERSVDKSTWFRGGCIGEWSTGQHKTKGIRPYFQRSQEDKNGKSDRKFFRCRDPNHLIRECLKPPKEKNQRALVGGSWSDSGEEDDEKVKDETCLMAQASSKVHSESSYFSDENSSIDDFILDSEYDK
ncbi:hypothetical protein Tco_0860660 [Tanacetum coccineum]|uniref:Alpha/beta hydrolases superfamily protein n=1 Tax=Tanacetum coccineum TaxID=301880 RepID=A0ABQ5BIL6_9ASTR